MADIPVETAIKTTLMLAQRVELLIDDRSATDTDTDVDDRLTTMIGLRFGTTHPKQRNNMGTERFYSFAKPDLNISFTLNATTDVMDFIETRGQMTTSYVLTEYKWAMKATSVNGTAKTIEVIGVLDNHEYSKNEGDQVNPLTVFCNVTITDDEYSIS